MPKDDPTKGGQETPLRIAGVVPSARIQECLAALAQALEDEVSQVLTRTLDLDRVYKEVLADTILLTRARAARIMSISPASLDRKVANKEIEATYPDSHPRFRLSEINRFIQARTGGKRRGRGRRGSV